MARRGDEAQAEPLEIVESVAERVNFEFAAVARAGVDRADRQRAAEPLAGALAQCLGRLAQRKRRPDRFGGAIVAGPLRRASSRNVFIARAS